MGSRGRAESCQLAGCSERGTGALAAREDVGTWGGTLLWQARGLLPPLLRLVTLEGVRLRGRLAQWCGALVALATQWSRRAVPGARPLKVCGPVGQCAPTHDTSILDGSDHHRGNPAPQALTPAPRP